MSVPSARSTPERGAQHVALDVVGGEAVAGEEHVDPAALDEAGDVGGAARVHHRRPAHGQHLAAGVVGGADPVGDLLHHERLRLLRAHLAVHELEHRGASLLGRSVDPHTAVADHDLVADAHPVHRDGAHPATVDDEPAVHLRVLHRHPLAVDEHVGGEVGGGVEAGREHAVAVSGDEREVAGGDPVGAVDLERLDEPVELVLFALELDARAARIGVGAPDLDVGQVVGDTGLDDGVEDLGEEQRVDDVAGQLDGLGGHTPWVACRHLWVSRSPSSRSTPPPTRPSCGSRPTGPLSGMGHERYVEPPERAAPAAGRRAGPAALRGRRRGGRAHQRHVVTVTLGGGQTRRGPGRRRARSCSSTTATRPPTRSVAPLDEADAAPEALADPADAPAAVEAATTRRRRTDRRPTTATGAADRGRPRRRAGRRARRHPGGLTGERRRLAGGRRLPRRRRARGLRARRARRRRRCRAPAAARAPRVPDELLRLRLGARRAGGAAACGPARLRRLRPVGQARPPLLDPRRPPTRSRASPPRSGSPRSTC